MRIGIDLGGTKIEGLALGQGGEELARKRVDTPKGDYAGTLGAIARLVTYLEAETGETGTVGVGIPGTISPSTGLVKNANSTWIIGKKLDADLGDLLGRPVRLANDANCFTLSEASDGAGAGAHCVFGVIVGTGCGAGVVIEGRELVGRHAVAGEWGHNPLPWMTPDEHPGPECYCGMRGCTETFLSGTGLARDFREATGQDMTAKEIVGAAEAGDGPAEAALDRYEDRMARALASVINILDPDVIVLGGGMSNVRRLYTSVPARLATYVFSDHCTTPILPPKHGDSSGVRGAAWLWSEGATPG